MNIFICGGVNKGMDKKYLKGIDTLAKKLVEAGHSITCVGATTGAIGAMYNSYKKLGGRVLIMVPDCYTQDAVGIDNQIISLPNLYSMQQFALKNSQATIFLPGGNGTIAELFMTIDNVKSGFDTDPIILFNISKFYSPFTALEQELIKIGLVEPSQNDKVFLCDTPGKIVKLLSTFEKKQA